MTDMADSIRADREAGTPGKWDWCGGDGPQNPYAAANIGIWSEVRLEDAIEAGSTDPDDEKWLAGIWGDIDGEDCSNARRIARLPDLEEAYLALLSRAEKAEAERDALRGKPQDERIMWALKEAWDLGNEHSRLVCKEPEQCREMDCRQTLARAALNETTKDQPQQSKGD